MRHSYRVTFQGKNGFHSEKLEEGKPRKEELIGGQSVKKNSKRFEKQMQNLDPVLPYPDISHRYLKAAIIDCRLPVIP